MHVRQTGPLTGCLGIEPVSVVDDRELDRVVNSADFETEQRRTGMLVGVVDRLDTAEVHGRLDLGWQPTDVS